MSEENLTKDDLVLLMESYRNMITMHQTILDQSSKTIEKLDGVMSKQDNILSKQTKTCGSIDNIIEKLNNLVNANTNIATKVDGHLLKSIEDHGILGNKIHLGWIGMGTIILSLIGLILTLIHYHKIITP